jgi:uncharacterized lipoprotein YajG
MSIYIRFISALATTLLLAACSTAGDVKPNAGATAQNSNCVAQTGSRITSKDSNCDPTTRTYTSDDINKTGITPAQNGLQYVDTSLTIHH